MRSLFIISLCTLCFACVTHKNAGYDVADSVVLKWTPTDSVRVHEIRFRAQTSATDLIDFMVKTHGKWQNSIKTDRSLNVYVWESIKLLENNDERFTVAVSGEDCTQSTMTMTGPQQYGRLFYCSAIVFDSENEDCFSSNYPLKEPIAHYLIKGSKTVNRDETLPAK